MITDIYTLKSFIAIGDSLKKCYGCDYCRANDDSEYHFHKVPGDINPIFRNLPVVVNLFYGDPTLQWENTLNLLNKLEKDNHKGTVVLITKGKLKDIPKMNIDLHIGISIGPDNVSHENFEHNLDIANNSWYKFNIEYRPICKDINDSDNEIDYIFNLAEKYNTCVAYSGLQLPPKPLDKKYIPYDNRIFSGQKYIGKDITVKIKEKSVKHNVPIFNKTSCLISYMHNYDRDFNAHYLKPIGAGCDGCLNHAKCSNFKFEKIKLPFDYDVIERDNYTCSFVRNGLCKFPNKECLNIKGTFIQPKLETVTRGDARIIKWLTGCIVDNVKKLVETPYISDFWNNNLN